MQQKIIYSFEEIQKLYPTDEYITHPKTNILVPKHNYIWKYSNRLLIQSINSHTGSCNYHSYIMKDNMCEKIGSSHSYKEIAKFSEDFWNPKPEYKTIDRKQLALEMIEDTIVSFVTKNKVDQLKKKHCCYIHVGADKQWHAYYPDVKVLLDFHLTQGNIKQQYVDFLNSNEFLEIRNLWDKSEVVDIGE